MIQQFYELPSNIKVINNSILIRSISQDERQIKCDCINELWRKA